MRAVDTNILARFILNDDEIQSSVAQDIIREGVYVSLSVWMELVWLLQARYRFSRPMVADVLGALMQMDGLITPESAHWALDRYRDGADFADMVHLIEAQIQNAFLTFDRDLPKDAGDEAPVKIEVVR